KNQRRHLATYWKPDGPIPAKRVQRLFQKFWICVNLIGIDSRAARRSDITNRAFIDHLFPVHIQVPGDGLTIRSQTSRKSRLATQTEKQKQIAPSRGSEPQIASENPFDMILDIEVLKWETIKNTN
ncbi:hypothetical protein C9985_01120, partial [Marinobacter vinifirmus]